MTLTSAALSQQGETMQRSTLRSKPRAFTLIELITVITIIVILLGVMLPTISNLLRGNNQKQALNIISAYIASARATALNNKVPAGVIFYEDPANKNATAMVLVIQDQTVTNPAVINPVLGASITLKAVSPRIDFVPVGIKVAALSNTQSFALDSSVTAGARIVLFDASGQVSLRSLISGGANTAWNLDSPTTASGVSSPAVVVFDSGQLNGDIQAKGLSGAAAVTEANQWLVRYADTVVINSYTGNVIR